MDENDSKPIKPIEFTSVQERKLSVNKKKPNNSIAVPILWIIFIFLIACGFSVFYFLPEVVEEIEESKPDVTKTKSPTADKPKISEPEVQIEPSLSPEELLKLKSEAERLLVLIIKKQEALQEKGVEKWAKNSFLEAVNLGTKGDEFYRKQQFDNAITTYKDTILLLDQIEKQAMDTLEKHLEEGELALVQGEQDVAIYNFDIAKAIDEKNIQAINGLKRAQTISELYKLLEKGGNLEAAGRLESAKQTYEQAYSLDPLSTEAKSAVERVAAHINEQKFTRLISLGYTSLNAREFEDARNAFKKAKKLNPNSKQPDQGISKINQAIRQDKIAALKVEAEYFESNEEWDYASQSYKQIIELSPKSDTAQDGFERNQQRAQILTKLDDYITNKDRLSSMQVRAEARRLLEEITPIEMPGSKINTRADTLEELLEVSSMPINLALISDNQTNVVIYKVGKFGLFENKIVTLKPGKYTIVGTRNGFRDVRIELDVSSSMETKEIKVLCEEPI